MAAIEHLLPKADAVIVGGAMAYTFLKAMGKGVGSSRVEDDRLVDAKRALGMAAASRAKLHLPEDHVCAPAFDAASPATVIAGEIPTGQMGLDIGPRTRAAYAGALKAAKTIVWNGPMGVFEWEAFAAGTRAVAEAIAEATGAGATSIVGGGDSAAAVEKFGLAAAMSHVSTGGGASLEMLEGKRFESVDLLDEA
jgi:3-phosphoglycerate kinase